MLLMRCSRCILHYFINFLEIEPSPTAGNAETLRLFLKIFIFQTLKNGGMTLWVRRFAQDGNQET
jgi:hypothetical protein